MRKRVKDLGYTLQGFLLSSSGVGIEAPGFRVSDLGFGLGAKALGLMI